MKKQDATEMLLEKIRQQEILRDAELVLLKAQFKLTAECLRPINLLKNAFAAKEPKKESDTLDNKNPNETLAKKIIGSLSANPLINLVGTILKIGVSNLIAKNPETSKSLGNTIINKLFRKKRIQE